MLGCTASRHLISCAPEFTNCVGLTSSDDSLIPHEGLTRICLNSGSQRTSDCKLDHERKQEGGPLGSLIPNPATDCGQGYQNLAGRWKVCGGLSPESQAELLQQRLPPSTLAPGVSSGTWPCPSSTPSTRGPSHLRLPLHAGQGDGQQHGDGDHADDADIVGGVHDRVAVFLGEGKL